VNAIAVTYVNMHLEELRAEAQRNRMASLVPHRSMRQRIADTGARLRRALRSESPGPLVPPLKNYPYGG
jgi:hypothetical protein